MKNYGFQVTTEDIDNVILLNGMIGLDSIVTEDAANIFIKEHADRIEKAALYGSNLEQQTEYAYQEIKDILLETYPNYIEVKLN